MNEVMPKKFSITVNNVMIYECNEKDLAMSKMMQTDSSLGLVELKENGVTVHSKGSNEKPKH